jgi:hypothetical protein
MELINPIYETKARRKWELLILNVPGYKVETYAKSFKLIKKEIES